MPRRNSSAVPSYRKHNSSGLAVTTINGKDIYLGPYGTKASKLEYDRVIGEWLAAGRTLRQAERELTVVEVCAAYQRWAATYYLQDGKPTSTLPVVKLVLRTVCREFGYGRTPAADFGPLALQACLARWADAGKSRNYINKAAGIIKRAFRWAVAQQLLPPSVIQALSAVGGLKKGRSTAREPAPVTALPDDVFEATLPHLPETVADMCRLMRLTGARPGEIAILRPVDVDRSGEVWTYTPARHKTDYRGLCRTVAIGPKAQAILAPYLEGRAEHLYCFQPKEARRRQLERMRLNRKTKVQPSQVNRSKPGAKRKPGECYGKDAINRAITRACDQAFPPPPPLEGEALQKWRKAHRWSANRLRHSAATQIRREFGLEHAQVALGHSKADVTQIYAERNSSLAAEVAKRIG